MEAGCLGFGGADAVFLGTAPRQAPPHLAPPHSFVEQVPGTLAPLIDDTEETPGKEKKGDVIKWERQVTLLDKCLIDCKSSCLTGSQRPCT